MSDKGAALNKRVWTLFSNLGFTTKPSVSEPAEHEVVLDGGKKRTLDLLAVDKALGVTIIGWNKSGENLKDSLSVHLHDYEKLKGIVGAQGVLFVTPNMEITDDDKTYAEKVGIRFWGEDELAYYEALEDTVGQYAKYEIIHSLRIQTSEEKNTYTFLALKVQQPFSDSNDPVFLFTASPEFLLRTSVVLRKAEGSKDAYQRIVQRKRLHKLKQFLTQKDALLPPNIIVHFSDDVHWSSIPLPKRDKDNKPITFWRPTTFELVALNVPSTFASLEIIDGQHRLFGFVNAEPATKKEFNLVVAGMAGLTNKRRTQAFVSINDNARRMDPNLVAYLRYDPDETSCQGDHQLMAIKVVVELNRTSPLKKKIRLLDIGNQRITLKGFAGYDLKGLIGARGVLRKYYKNQSGEYVGALRLYFSTLRGLFKKQWKDPDRYIVFTNRGVAAFLKLLKSILRTTKAPLDHATLKKYLGAIRKEWPDKDWETQELANSYVGSQGWKNFHRDLVKAVRKHNPEFKE